MKRCPRRAVARNTWNLRATTRRASHRASGGSAEAREEGFELAQWALQTGAADALAQMSVRFAKGAGPLAATRAGAARPDRPPQGEDKRPARRRGRGRRQGGGNDRVRRSRPRCRLDAIDARIASGVPEYAGSVGPKAARHRRGPGLLQRDEAFVLFLDVPRFGRLPEETLVWVVTKTERAGCSIASRHQGARRQRGGAALRPGSHAVASAGSAEGAGPRSRLRRARRRQTASKDERAGAAFDLARAHELYKALFGPVEDLIKGKHLLIVPRGRSPACRSMCW